MQGFGGIGGFIRYKMDLNDVIGDASVNYDKYEPDESLKEAQYCLLTKEKVIGDFI